MKVLYVTGACLDKNTSANMSHNAFVLGLLNNGAELDIIMASDSWGERDNVLKRQEGAHYYVYGSVSTQERLRRFGRRIFRYTDTDSATRQASSSDVSNPGGGACFRSSIRNIVKGVFNQLFKSDPVYPLHLTWLRNAVHFRQELEYDLVVSNSSPSAGHRLVVDLTDKNRIKYKRWVQIWEDPWYYDLYSQKSESILAEEHFLLSRAQEILYVSPLTLKYQKEFFSDCAEKMGVIPLPAYSLPDTVEEKSSDLSFGYFGDYYSSVRNIQPFYDALKESKIRGYIYGDSDLKLKSTEEISVSGRVTLDILGEIQDKTSVLVQLSNLRGGQIPGKIYHYSATTKPILFILDGTEEEQRLIKEYFSKYDRFIFCSNTKEDIIEAMKYISNNINGLPSNVVKSFYPKEVVSLLLNDRNASND
jgi:hypothetical protein